VRLAQQQAGRGHAAADTDQHEPVSWLQVAARKQQSPGRQPGQRQGRGLFPGQVGRPRVADRGRYVKRFLERPVGVLAQDRHLQAMDFLTRPAGVALAAGDDRVHDNFVAEVQAFHAIADGVDHACAVGPQDGRQWALGQAAGDEHVQMIEGHIAQPHPYLMRTRRLLGPLAQLQRSRTVKAHEFQRPHLKRVVGRCQTVSDIREDPADRFASLRSLLGDSKQAVRLCCAHAAADISPSSLI
jgi:hypothetical protein